VEASWLLYLVRYFGREAAVLFAQYPVLWGAAVIAILAAWKAMELLLWLFAKTLRVAVAALLATAIAAAYFYLRGGQ
jgi:hypothetical protein